MKITVDDKMQQKIKKFLKSWKETENDEMFDINDYDSYMDDAVELLKEIVGETDEGEDLDDEDD